MSAVCFRRKNKLNEIKDRIKPFLPDYVQEITKKSGGKNQYICPFCNSGTGKQPFRSVYGLSGY